MGTMDQRMVNVRVLLADDEGPHCESFWTTPVNMTSGGGTVRCENNCFLAPFVLGDHLRVQLDGDSRYQVTALEEPRPVWGYTVILHDVTDETARAFGDRVREVGGTPEFAAPTLAVVVADTDQIAAALHDLFENDDAVEQFSPTRTPDDIDMTEIVLELATEPTVPPHTTSYWAPDDPWWAEQDLNHPEFLAAVQHLAHTDARVAKALENGRHDQVVTFMSRMAASARGEKLEPLDGPLFTD